MTERTITVEREVIEQASLAVRETAKALITLEETLKQPYPDDPRWSPWTRFIDRNEYSPWSLLAKADTALKAALSSDHQGGRGEVPSAGDRALLEVAVNALRSERSVEQLAERYYGAMSLPFDSGFADADEEVEDRAAMQEARRRATAALDRLAAALTDQPPAPHHTAGEQGGAE